ncbi:hypothetical protein GCM10007897_24050 [Sphingobium jiangsuense]|uniref:Iron transporter n=1 Tax=Sphingobium jiangsuense TaxID=870476 RepID=A0A7W6BKA5_9SPHN|nr:iron transporter [Sphingobium jiangsuense]MBB3928621.1 hypothetical protein [Sphingobium jiangsuense]GLT01014.1 hypothetical protein GCM10007897_24050 [Sphingobium jiangsuense]
MTGQLTPAARYRLSVASRVAAAILGGYALAAAIKLLLTLTLPFEPGPFNPPAMAAKLLIYAIHTAILLWAFHTRSVTRLWFWLIAWTGLVYLACWLVMRLGGLGA